MNGSHSKCKICQLPDKARKEINRQLLGNGNLSALAQHYNVSRDSLYRHRANHIGPAASKGVRKAAENYGVELLRDMQDLMETSKQILQSAMEDNLRSLSLKAVKEVRANTEVLGKIIFSMDQQASGGLDPAELQEFREWKLRKANEVPLDVSKMSPLGRRAMEELARLKLQQTEADPRHDVQDIEIIEEEVPAKRRMRRRKSQGSG